MSEIRFDKVVSPKTKITKEGFVKGEAVLTRAGVFEYVNKDGSIRRELRHPDDVFNSDSLATLKLIPITNEHPTELVNVDNAAELSIGSVGESITIDNPFIVSTYNITHKDAIEQISKGKKAFSLGYTLDLIREDGVYEGEKFTHRQTNIRYNHLALVKQGRAGREARINFDNALFESDKLTTKEINKMNEEDAKALQSRNDHLEKEIFHAEKIRTDLKEELDKLQARFDQLNLENTELKSVRSDSLVNEKAKERVKLLTKATKFLNLDSLDEFSDREIMEKVITNHDSSIDLSQKSDEYVAARFDTIVEFVGDKTAITKQMKNLDGGVVGTVIRNDAIADLNKMFKEAAAQR